MMLLCLMLNCPPGFVHVHNTDDFIVIPIPYHDPKLCECDCPQPPPVDDPVLRPCDPDNDRPSYGTGCLSPPRREEDPPLHLWQ